MSATDIINELPKLTTVERKRVLSLLLDLEQQDEAKLQESTTPYRAVDLAERGMNLKQAADLRARLRTFAEDWDRPEASIYDEDSTR